jgi:O-antigen/teichoic acid export membrane protein
MQALTIATHLRRLSTYGITLASGVVQILTAIYLSRAAFNHLPQAQLKIWFLMLAIMPFIGLFELGANVVLPHKIASVKYEPAAVGEIASNFLVTVLIVLLAGTALGLVSLWVCWEFQVLSSQAAMLLGALVLAAAVRVVANVFHGFLYAQGENVYDKSLRVAATLTLAVVAGVGLHYGMSLWAMPLAWASGGLVSIVAALYRQHTRWHVRLSLQYIQAAAVQRFLKESVRYIFIALPGQLVFNATPFIIASRLPTEYTVAYGLTQQLLAGISLVVSLPITVAAPRLAGMYQRDRAAAQACAWWP